jgi:hypothetical protein
LRDKFDEGLGGDCLTGLRLFIKEFVILDDCLLICVIEYCHELEDFLVPDIFVLAVLQHISISFRHFTTLVPPFILHIKQFNLQPVLVINEPFCLFSNPIKIGLSRVDV